MSLKKFLLFWHLPKIQRAQIGLLVAGLFISVFVYAPARASEADDFVVSVYSDDLSQTFRTRGGTVGDLLKNVDITLGSYDLVEPAVETSLTGPVFKINVYRARPVVIIDEDQSITVNSAHTSAKLIATSAGLTIYREDILTLERVDDFVGAGIIGERLTIKRAVPVVIDLYGKKIEHRTHRLSVGEVLDELKIVPDSQDTVTYKGDMPVRKNMKIRVIRVGKQVEIRDEIVEFGTKVIWDEDLDYGTQIIEQEGINGQRVVTYEVEYHNGKEVAREALKTVVSLQPQEQIVRAGHNAPLGISNKLLGEQLSKAKGWTGAEWVCLLQLWDKESHWNNLAQNLSSTAFGIPQFLNSTWAGTGYKKTTDPTTQIMAGMVYIQNRYGKPCGAWQHSVIHNWY